ncbi:MAG: serine/threonine protein kinase [Myxococcales bacterium]|nr:serine/threonine protein kinase [Myxococcales bacterium]
MAEDDYDDEAPTLPPLDPRSGPVCPRCYAKLSLGDALEPGELPRCPKHGLPYVDAREVVESGGDALLGSSVAGRFTILARVGAGSMGAVYRARQDAVGRDVALKIVHGERAYDAETKVRFEREARATSALVSPHTVTVFDFGEAADGSWFLAMELLEGATLGEQLRRVPRFSAADAVRIARQAAVSLSEAHAKGIVHRDLKPDNLFLAKVPVQGGALDEVVKVLDFGIAKLVHGDERRMDQLETQAGTVFGTPRYMSPEQAQGAPLDARTDLYSLGVILYQMLAGRPPFVDDDAVVVMACHIKEPPPAFAEVAPEAYVPLALEAVVRRALQKNPDARHQSAEAFIVDLDVALAQSGAQGTGLHATSWVTPPERKLAGSRTRVLVAGLAAMAALGTGGFLLVKKLAAPPALQAGPPEPNQGGLAPPVGSEPAAALAPTPIASAEPEVDPQPDAGRRPRARKLPRLPPPTTPALPPAPAKPEGYGRFE